MTIADQDALRSPRLALRSKRVKLVETYSDHTGKVVESPYREDLIDLRRRIIGGLGIDPKFYRQNMEDSRDQLLTLFGVKHLHLGGQKSDVLIYLVEYEDYVAILEINDHKHFRSDPVGKLLAAHKDALAKLKNAEAAFTTREQEAAKQKARRKDALAAARMKAAEAEERAKSRDPSEGQRD